MSAAPIRVKPATRLILSMYPYLKIEKNEDGTGGGITLRIGGAGESQMVDVVWGQRTEIEVILP